MVSDIARALGGLVLLAALAACQIPPGGWIHCPAPLRPVAELGHDRALRAAARVERAGHVAYLDLSIEKRPNEFVMVARNELGAIAFALVQRGQRVEVVRSLPRALLPLPPEALLADVQQAFFSASPAQSDRRIARCGYTVHFSSPEATR